MSDTPATKISDKIDAWIGRVCGLLGIQRAAPAREEVWIEMEELRSAPDPGAAEREEAERREAEERRRQEAEERRRREEAERLARARREWTERHEAIKFLVLTLAKSDIGDVSAMRAANADTIAKAEAGDPDAALVSLARLERLVEQARSEAGAPGGVEPGLVGRLSGAIEAQRAWAGARLAAAGELDTLVRAIEAACAPDPETRPVAEAAGGLRARLAPIDGRLEKALAAVAIARGAEVDGRLAAAREASAAYRQVFDDPFFREAEAGSGFGSFAIRSSALAGLDAVDRALAG